MIAELLTFEHAGPVKDLLRGTDSGGYPLTKQRQDPKTLMSCVLRRFSDTVANGGTIKVYTVRSCVSGMVVVAQDEWALRELGRPGYRIEYLAAVGRTDQQLCVKTSLLQDVQKTLPRGAPLVAQTPHTDLTGIRALERCGFVTTQTKLLLAADIADAEMSPAPADLGYGVQSAELEDLDRLDDEILHVPDGLFGWDAYLPYSLRTRVHRDWLQSYARDHSLLLAFHHGRPVGLLAEHLCEEHSLNPEYAVGRIDLISTAAEYRNNGVTRTLMNHAFALFRDRGARRVELLVPFADAPAMSQLDGSGFSTLGGLFVMTNWRGI